MQVRLPRVPVGRKFYYTRILNMMRKRTGFITDIGITLCGCGFKIGWVIDTTDTCGIYGIMYVHDIWCSL